MIRFTRQRKGNLMLYKSFSGHIHFGSPYELSNNCGTCDGANCDFCRDVYTVKDLEIGKVIYSGYSKEEAESILELGKVED